MKKTLRIYLQLFNISSLSYPPDVPTIAILIFAAAHLGLPLFPPLGCTAAASIEGTYITFFRKGQTLNPKGVMR
jgi:hypothetical protein